MARGKPELFHVGLALHIPGRFPRTSKPITASTTSSSTNVTPDLVVALMATPHSR
jgi:hypothetical protein